MTGNELYIKERFIPDFVEVVKALNMLNRHANLTDETENAYVASMKIIHNG